MVLARPVIETQALCKTYGRFGALNGVSLAVPAGSVFALLGASGAGKTTLVKILMNLSAATTGTATVLGVRSDRLGPGTLAEIGYVSENQVMPARLRVAQFFDFLRPCYATWDRALEHDLRERLRLPPKRKLGELSHGMRLKMALACALPFKPRLLVLDEPLSGLDALARDDIIEVFMGLAGRTTILISSHELDEVQRFATHVAFLHEGRSLFQGSVEQLAEHVAPLLATGSGVHPVSLRSRFVALVRAARAG